MNLPEMPRMSLDPLAALDEEARILQARLNVIKSPAVKRDIQRFNVLKAEMEEIIERLSAVYNGSPLRHTPTTVDQPPSEHKKKKAKVERQKPDNRSNNATVSAEEISLCEFMPVEELQTNKATVSAEDTSPEVLSKEEIDKLSSSDFAIYNSQIKAKGRSTTPVGGRKV